MTDIFDRHHKIVLAEPNADGQTEFYSFDYAAHRLTMDKAALRFFMQEFGLAPYITRFGIYISGHHVRTISSSKWNASEIVGVLGYDV